MVWMVAVSVTIVTMWKDVHFSESQGVARLDFRPSAVDLKSTLACQPIVSHAVPLSISPNVVAASAGGAQVPRKKSGLGRTQVHLASNGLHGFVEAITCTCNVYVAANLECQLV